MKKSTYVLTISEQFPKTHPRAGEPTNFVESIWAKEKIHTIRGNYELWRKRFEKIEAGEAVLSVRVWAGKPYNSKQRECFVFDKADGIGIQKLSFEYNIHRFVIGGKYGGGYGFLAKNDGLSKRDFKDWFAKYDLSEPMAIIHFTDFRY